MNFIKKIQMFNSGMSLIEVSIAMAVVLILSLGIARILQNQQVENRAIGEKMLTYEVKTQLQNALMNSNFCGCLFRGKTFDSTNLVAPWSSSIAPIPYGYTQPIPASPTACTDTGGYIVPAVGQKIGKTQVEIKSVGVNNVIDQGGGSYTSNIVVKFEPASLVRELREFAVPIRFSVDLSTGAPNTALPFLSCGSSGGSLTYTNCAWEPYGCGQLLCSGQKVQRGLQTQPGFNEDCGGGGNDYDEPGRRIYCCDVSF